MGEIENKTDLKDRASRLLAKVRHRQLVTALMGKVRDSANYAQLAMRIRREVQI